jgi:predicted nucleic acid-binding protein
MSRVVLDASVGVALAVDEPSSGASVDAVKECDVIVPEVFWVDVSNALLRKVRHAAIDRREALDAYALLRRLVDHSVATEPLGPLAMGLSMDLDHPVYDCVYLAAAISHQAPLLTADRALHAAAVGGGYRDWVRLIG